MKFGDISHNRALGAHEWGPRVRTLAGGAPKGGSLARKVTCKGQKKIAAYKTCSIIYWKSSIN